MICPICEQPFDETLRDYPERAKVCSVQCAARSVRKKLTREGQRRGGLKSAAIRRKRAEAKWATLSKAEIFHLGYRAGYQKALIVNKRAA